MFVLSFPSLTLSLSHFSISINKQTHKAHKSTLHDNMAKTQIQYYDRAVTSTINEFLHQQHYPLFECVLRQFLVKFRAPSLQHLGFTQLPSLDLLHDLQQKVSSFINAYVGTQSIVSYYDLEQELCGMLRSFNIPVKTVTTEGDPNEVKIDSDMYEECVKQVSDQLFSFEEFGIGPLYLHPLVQQMFPRMNFDGISSSRCRKVSTADIITRQNEFQSSCSSTGFNSGREDRDRGREKVRVDLTRFQAFVCQYYEVSHVSAVGVLLRGTLEAELLMLRHVSAQREQLLLGLQKEYFEGMQEQYGSSSTSQLSSQQEKPIPPTLQPAIAMASAKLDICPATRTETVNLLARFSKQLDCPYAPSFGKSYTVLETLWAQDKRHALQKQEATASHGSSNGSSSGHSQPKKRRRQGTTDTAITSSAVTYSQLSVLEKEMLSATTEYVMLHVGGSKYKNRQLCIKPSTGAVSGGEVTAEDVDSSGDGSDESDTTSSGGSSDSCDDSSSSSGAEESSDSDGDSDTSSDDDESDNADCSSSEDSVVVTVPSQVLSSSSTTTRSSIPKSSPACTDTSTPFEGKMVVGSWRSEPTAIETIEVAAFLPWCRHNSLSPQASKVDYLRAVGRWGESLVYQYLLFQYPDRTVTWLNEQEETNASYDLKLERKHNNYHNKNNCQSQQQVVSGARTIFVEVKATQFSDKNVFQISKCEWDFMASLPRVQYDVYRVYNAGNGNTVRLAVYHDVFKLVEERKIQLCLAV